MTLPQSSIRVDSSEDAGETMVELFGLSSATPVAKETAVNRATVRKQRFGTLLIGTESALMELDIGGEDRIVADGGAQRIMSRSGVLIQRTNDFAEVLLNRRAVLFRR